MDKKYLSLTEAAELLRVDPEDLKTMREQGDIRGFADRGTWKFRSTDVENLLRSRQVDSDPEVPVYGAEGSGAGAIGPAGESDIGLESVDDSLASVLGDDDPGEDPTTISKKDDLSRSDSDVRLIVDDSVSLADSDPELSIVDGSDSDVTLAAHSDSDVRLSTESGVLEGSGLLVGSVGEIDIEDHSDSDVQLVAAGAEDDSDSDVQLMEAGSGTDGDSDSDVRLSSHEIDVPQQPDSDSDVKLVDVNVDDGSDDAVDLPTEMELDLAGGQSDSDVVLPDSLEMPSGHDTASDVQLPADDDSGITLEFDDDDTDDSASVLLGADDSGITLEGGSGLLMSGDSGISLEGPSDSGISLDLDDEGISLAQDTDSIELDAVGDSGISLEADSGIALADDGGSGVDFDDGTASELEVFDDVPETQFEIPAEGQDSEFDLDTDASDFEIEDADATAEFDLDDSFDSDTGEFDLDDADMSDVSDFDSLDAASVADIDLLEGDDAFDDESFESEAGGYGAMAGMARPAAAAKQEWSTWVVATSIVSCLCMAFAAVMSFDLLGNIYSWNSADPWTGFVIDSLSGLFT